MRTQFFLPLLCLSFIACSEQTNGSDDKPEGAGDDGGDGGDGGTTDDGGDGSSGDDGGGDDGGGDDGSMVDDDGDGFSEADGDCNDTNSDVYPGAAEYCNDRDDDCDDEVDEPEDLAEGQGDLRFADADGDGYGDPSVQETACDGSEGWVDDDTDCDDGAASAYPGGTEVNWNGTDEDCDGVDFDLDGCLARAVTATAEDWGDGSTAHAMTDFYGTYDLDVTWPIAYTFSGAGYGSVENQTATITDVSHALYEDGGDYAAVFETTLEYNSGAAPFTINVGVEASYWTAGLLGYTLGDIMTYLVGLVADLPEDWDGTFSCYGYVDATPVDFDGMATLDIDAARESVTADVTLASNVTSFTEGDTTLTALDGSQCSNDIINSLAGYMGIGDTYVFLNENLVLVGEELVAGYEASLEAHIAAECSAP